MAMGQAQRLKLQAPGADDPESVGPATCHCPSRLSAPVEPLHGFFSAPERLPYPDGYVLNVASSGRSLSTCSKRESLRCTERALVRRPRRNKSTCVSVGIMLFVTSRRILLLPFGAHRTPHLGLCAHGIRCALVRPQGPVRNASAASGKGLRPLRRQIVAIGYARWLL
jgi:hypothetical protein